MQLGIGGSPVGVRGQCILVHRQFIKPGGPASKNNILRSFRYKFALVNSRKIFQPNFWCKFMLTGSGQKQRIGYLLTDDGLTFKVGMVPVSSTEASASLALKFIKITDGYFIVYQVHPLIVQHFILRNLGLNAKIGRASCRERV